MTPGVRLAAAGNVAKAWALVVGIALDDTGALAADSVKASLTPDQLDSYLAVEPDGTIVVFYGRIDGGHSQICGAAVRPFSQDLVEVDGRLIHPAGLHQGKPEGQTIVNRVRNR